MTEMNGKQVKFQAQAERRVSRAIRAIRQVGKLSQRGRYEYDEKQIDQIFKALHVELDDALKGFSPPPEQTKGQGLFRFE